jgi:hypothetical protein
LESIPPSTPGSLSATGLTSTSIRVSWTASTDTGGSGLAGYKVYRAGILRAPIPRRRSMRRPLPEHPDGLHRQGVDGVGNCRPQRDL